MFRSLLAFCMSLALVVPALGGFINDNAGHALSLPLPAPGFGIYNSGNPPELGYPSYSFIMILDGQDSYSIQTNLCGGACRVFVSSYSGSYQQTDRNYLNPHSAPGMYMIFFQIPQGYELALTVIYEKVVDNSTTPVQSRASLVVLRIANPAPYVEPSSTGPAVVWPGGRGPIGLFIEDELSSAFLPYAEGWTWTEFDRDVTSYRFRVSFSYHLMEMDGFFIEPRFGDSTLGSMVRVINGTTTPGNWLGSYDNMNMDDDSIYDYHITIPQGGYSVVTLHYVYRVPGEQTRNQTVVVTIGNFYGVDPTLTTNPVLTRNSHKLQIDAPTVTEATTGASSTTLQTNDKPVEVSVVQNGASSASMSVLVAVVCVCFGFMTL